MSDAYDYSAHIETVVVSDLRKEIATLTAKLERVRGLAKNLEYRAINAKLQGELREHNAHFILKELDEILREVWRE